MSLNAGLIPRDRPLPSGTVTFLFSDIEGSTQRWESRREAMQQALVRHDVLMREAIMAHGGGVFKTIGDAFCAVFPTAPAAVAAALSAQRALNKEDWNAVEGLRVRMAVHTGDTQERDGDYFGPAVNRVARLLAIGHGGQVLVSGVAAELAQSALPSQVVLRDLGTHRLRDLAHPEQVFQLNAPDLPADFPALRSLEALPNNLPLQVTSFVGRDTELAEIKELLGKTRLLTLFGAGGVGKTRAAVQLGADLLDAYPDGVWFADLAVISDPQLVPAQLASAVGVQESADKPLAQTLVASLMTKHALIILDSCEHVISAAATLADALLHGSSKIKIIATSREALGISGESVHRMPSLACSPQGEPLTAERAISFGAVALFAERAKAADSKFALTDENASVIADICRRLDGIALAIELAAPRVKVLNLKQLAQRLDERFRILTGGSRTALPRQQTMRALIDWSYDLLPAQEQQLFRMAAVFAGGWTLEAASAVCASGGAEDFEVLDVLSALVDKSLVQVEFSETSQRYRLLESTREYGLEKLEQRGERAAAERRRAEFFSKVAERAAAAYDTTPTHVQHAQLEPELENFRATLEWALTKDADHELGQRLAADLAYCQGATLEGPENRRWVKAARALADDTPKELTAYLWFGLAKAESDLVRYLAAVEAGERAVTMYEAIGDRLWACKARGLLGRSLCFVGRVAEGKVLLERALTDLRAEKLTKLVGTVLLWLGTAAMFDKSVHRARAYFREALPVCQAIGDERTVITILANTAEAEFSEGNVEEALRLGTQAIELGRKNRSSGAPVTLSNRAAYYIAVGRFREALADAREALQRGWQGRFEVQKAFTLQHIAAVAAAERDTLRAAHIVGWVDARIAALEARREPTEQIEYDELIASLHTQLGESELGRLMGEGRLWNEDRAVAEARQVEFAP